MRPRVFLADDSRAIRERLTELLSTAGTTIVGEATNVASVEQGIARTRPDLAILDLQMPGRPVLDLIRRLKDGQPDLRIAVMSTHAGDYRERILAAGADFVLHKPREIHQLEDIVRIVSNERRAMADSDDPPPGESSTAGSTRPPAPAPVVLNVDDYKASLYARTRILRRAGFEVLEASTGSEALRLTDQHHPDLVLLDVHLPDMSGFDVCRRIKEGKHAGVAVVHISATYRNERDRVDGLRLSGADAYLMEPIAADELVGVLGRILRREAVGQRSNPATVDEE